MSNSVDTKKPENVLLYDWVSITSKIHSPEQMISLLGIPSATWETVKGAHGYRDRYYWNFISIHYNGRPGMGVWLEMSGQGCRAFETAGHGDYGFLFWVVKQNSEDMKITRLDVAFDDHTGILDIEQIADDTRRGEYVSKALDYQCTYSSKGTSVVVGSPKSPVLIRIYDKARERGFTDGRHWIRIELQMRDSRCKEFVSLESDFGESFAGVLVNYLRYVDPDLNDSNRWRWPLKDYWSEVVGDACAISIYSKPGLEYNVHNCENYVYNHAGNAINALIKIYGVDTFLDKLRERSCKPNPKYDRMVEYELMFGELMFELEMDELERSALRNAPAVSRPVHR